MGKSFQNIIDDDIDNSLSERGSEDKKNKGNYGQILDERYFHYACDSDSNPDFNEAGVELKVTPCKENAKGALVAKERLILTMIDYFSVVNESFERSHLWHKCGKILLVYYLYQKEIPKRLDIQRKGRKLVKFDKAVILRYIYISKINRCKSHEDVRRM